MNKTNIKVYTISFIKISQKNFGIISFFIPQNRTIPKFGPGYTVTAKKIGTTVDSKCIMISIIR